MTNFYEVARVHFDLIETAGRFTHGRRAFFSETPIDLTYET